MIDIILIKKNLVIRGPVAEDNLKAVFYKMGLFGLLICGYGVWLSCFIVCKTLFYIPFMNQIRVFLFTSYTIDSPPGCKARKPQMCCFQRAK